MSAQYHKSEIFRKQAHNTILFFPQCSSSLRWISLSLHRFLDWTSPLDKFAHARPDLPHDTNENEAFADRVLIPDHNVAVDSATAAQILWLNLPGEELSRTVHSTPGITETNCS